MIPRRRGAKTEEEKDEEEKKRKRKGSEGNPTSPGATVTHPPKLVRVPSQPREESRRREEQ